MRDTHDVYVGILPRALARTGGGGRDSDIPEAAWLWADLDAHGASPADMSAFLHRMHARLPAPQMCVLSGSGGAHVYWQLSVPVSLTTVEARQKFADIVRQLAKVIGGTDGGIHADVSARNPSRILRVPGTWNHKHDPPAPVQGIACGSTSIKTLEEWEKDLAFEHRPAAKRQSETTKIILRPRRLGGREIDPVPAGLRAWAGKGYPEGQRHSRLTGVAAWLRRDTDLPESVAHEIFHCKAQASPGTHPLTETELEGIWQWA